MLHLTIRNFEIETKYSHAPAIVMFYAVWCGKCAMMKPVFEDIAKKYSQTCHFCEVDVDESETLAAEYGADIVPTFTFFKEGEIVGMLQGIIGQEVFEKRIEQMLS